VLISVARVGDLFCFYPGPKRLLMKHPHRLSRSAPPSPWRLRAVVVLSTSSLLAATQLSLGAAGQQQTTTPAAPAPPQTRCRVTGTVTSGTQPLPGVAIIIKTGTRLVDTSTDLEGKFVVLFDPNSTYHLSAQMTAFATSEQDVTTTAAPCDAAIKFNMALRPKTEPVAEPEQAATVTPTAPTTAGQPPATTAAGQPTTGATAPPTQSAANTTAGRSGRAGQAGPQFSTLTVQADANGTQATAEAGAVSADDLTRLLPPGFSLQNAQADAVAINGSGDALSIDRNAMNDRSNAISTGQFDPNNPQFANGPGGAGGAGGDQGIGGGGQGGGRGGPGGGGPGGGGRGGGGPGLGGFNLGGRGGRGQSLYQGSATYSYGGSSLDATPLTVGTNGTIIPAATQPFNRNNAGFTIGGPIKIPGLYADTNRRSNFQLNYTGNHTTTAATQILSVPTDAERNGDFSASLPTIQLVNPSTGQPFLNNQIPSNLINPVSSALLQFIPRATNQTTDQENLDAEGITLATANSLSLRLTQNLSPTVPAPGRGGPRGGGGGGGRGGGRGGRGLSIVLTGQLQYRENSNQTFNAVPALGGSSKSASITAPLSLNISKGRTVHSITFNVTHSNSQNFDSFENQQNVSGLAGIQYPGGISPFNFGVPNLGFTSFSSIRPASASQRIDQRISTGYSYSRTISKHQLHIGADLQDNNSQTQTNGNARGSYTFSGLYTTDGALTAGTSGADFADFLLGMPQQATLQVGGLTHLRERAFDAYLDDNWQKSSRMTLSLGLRYELTLPYVETSGQMANLDVTPNFTAAQVVCATSAPGCANVLNGPFTGAFPSSLLNTDTNNVGPRFGIVYRLATNTLLRGGYSITYNTGSYASIARQLVGQPPFAVAVTNTGTIPDPLLFQTALLQQQAATTNNYAVDKNYSLGMIQQWNATFSRDITRNITFLAGYTGTKGTDLDLLRAPNRTPDGTLAIAGVQPFIFESSGGRSLLNLANFQLRRRYAGGFSTGINYTLMQSKDNASSLGAGSTVVAQNDQNLGAEYALSNFDVKHTVTGDFTWELPFGANRRWLADPGFLNAVVGEWSMTLSVNAHSGTPFTPRVVGATSSIATNTSGSLRANIDPTATIALQDPSLADFFNTSAFSVPLADQFGTSPRNVIIGPGGHVVNATFSRDMRMGGNRAFSLQINANNLFNTIQWTTIDTNLLSRTYGQVTRIAPTRTLTINLRYRF
jgi:hypothetical protein